MTESVIADLMVVLSTKVDTAIAGFTEVSSAGEAMATKVAESTAEVTAASDKMAGSIASVGAAAETTAAKTSTQLSEADGRFVAAGGSAQRFGEQTTAASGEVDAATVRMAHALEKVGIAAETAATENKLAMDKMAADTAALSAKMELAAAKAGASVEGIGTAYGKADDASAKSSSGQTKNMGLAVLAVGAVGVAALDMAAKYESSTNRLVTSAGESEQALGQVRQGMLDMAGQVGVSADKLSQGMYTVESAGYHGSDGLKVLKAAAQGAKEENAQLSTVADAVSTALTDYHMSADQAATVTSQLVTAVGQGKTNMEDFSGSLHNVTPLASALGINLSDVTGTLAEMTAHGMSADQASQNLAHTMRSLVNPTSQQRDEFAQLGLSATDLSDHIGQRGISGTLQLLEQSILQHMGPSGKVLLDAFNQSKDAAANMNEAIGKMPKPLADLATQFDQGKVSLKDFTKQAKDMPGDAGQMAAAFLQMHSKAEGFTNAMKSGSPQAQNLVQALQKLTGTSDGLNTALMTTGENSAGVNQNVKKISGAAQEAGGNVKGWHDTQQTLNQKLDEAKASLSSMAIQVGNALIPAVKPAVDLFAKWATWLSQHQQLAKTLADILIGVLGAAVAVFVGNTVVNLAKMAGGLAAGVGKVLWWATTHVAQFAFVSAKAAFHAGMTVARWVGAGTAMVAQGVAKGAVWLASTLTQFATVAASAIVQAAATAGAWIGQTAAMVAQGAAKLAIWLAGWIAQTAVVVATNVASAAATVAAWVAANIAMIAATGGIVLLLGAVVAAAIYLWTHWSQIWDWIKNAAQAAWHWIDSNVIQPLVTAWHWLYDNAIKPVADFIGNAVHGIGQAFSDAFGWVKSIIQDVWNFIKPIFDAIGNAIGGVVKAVSGIAHGIGSAVSGIGHFLGFDDGGFVPGAQGAPMLAVVHGGEYVVSNDMQAGRAPIDPKLGGQLVSSGSGIRASGGGSGAGGGTLVQIIVQGNAVTERQLIDVVQTGMLRAGARRPVTYQNYRR